METQLSLLELNRQIRSLLHERFPVSLWVVAEISEINQHRSGHCYLELVEKNQLNQVVAKSRATIWSRTFRMLKPYFEQSTGMSLAAEQKVLVSVSVEFHELYGHSLNILDIDPNYTLGDHTRRRKEIIEKLRNEGVFDMNRELELPAFLQKIALISSSTAAGYGDFIDQLHRNQYGLRFETKLFPATMQGDKSPQSIMDAMNLVYESEENFDVLVIIRGGGSRSDLITFDDYELAYHCTQFPIPIFTGVGHDRDESIVDMVVYSAFKTPTAVAEFLIQHQHQHQLKLIELEDDLLQVIRERMAFEKNRLVRNSDRLVPQVQSILQRHKHRLQVLETLSLSASRSSLREQQNRIQHAASRLQGANALHTLRQRNKLDQYQNRLQEVSKRTLPFQLQRLQSLQHRLTLLDPVQVIKRGYTLNYQGNNIITSISQLQTDQAFETVFKDGKVVSKILSTKPFPNSGKSD